MKSSHSLGKVPALCIIVEEQQDMPPQKMPLQYVDYFELRALEEQQRQGEAFSELLLSA